MIQLPRVAPDRGWLALLGGGEFSFGETEAVDVAWLAHAAPGPIAFLPAASGSADYGKHFAVYLDEYFKRRVDVVPVYRGRDARRRANCDRLHAAAGIYLGGGVADHLLATVRATPVADALLARLAAGAVITGIAAGAQVFGTHLRGLSGGRVLPALALLRETVVDTNFEPGHDRRLRRLLAHAGGGRGLGIPAGCGVLVGPRGGVEVVGRAFVLDGPQARLERIDGIAPQTLCSTLLPDDQHLAQHVAERRDRSD